MVKDQTPEQREAHLIIDEQCSSAKERQWAEDVLSGTPGMKVKYLPKYRTISQFGSHYIRAEIVEFDQNGREVIFHRYLCKDGTWTKDGHFFNSRADAENCLRTATTEFNISQDQARSKHVNH
jgi:hypothetical protein